MDKTLDRLRLISLRYVYQVLTGARAITSEIANNSKHNQVKAMCFNVASTLSDVLIQVNDIILIQEELSR